MTTFSHVGSGALRRQSLTDMPIKSSATGPFLVAYRTDGRYYYRAKLRRWPRLLPITNEQLSNWSSARAACDGQRTRPNFFELYRSSKKLPSIARVAASDLGF